MADSVHYSQTDVKAELKIASGDTSDDTDMGEINACIGWNNMIDFKGGKPKNWYKHYDYTLSPEGECPNADYASKNNKY